MDVIDRRRTEIPRPRDRRSTRRRVFQGAVLLTVAGLAPAAGLHLYAADRIRSVRSVPSTDVVMVLGAGVQGDTPSALLARRLDVALDLYRRGKARVVLVTGDGGGNRYNETRVMRRYLAARGIPDGRIVNDDSGFTTWESCIRAKRVFGIDKAIVVTQDFHLTRALALCKAAGVDAYGVGDPSLTPGHIGPTLYGGAREIAAAFKAAGQILRKPAPRVTGARVNAIEEALRSAPV